MQQIYFLPKLMGDESNTYATGVWEIHATRDTTSTGYNLTCRCIHGAGQRVQVSAYFGKRKQAQKFVRSLVKYQEPAE